MRSASSSRPRMRSSASNIRPRHRSSVSPRWIVRHSTPFASAISRLSRSPLDESLYQYHKQIRERGTREFLDSVIAAVRADFTSVQIQALIATSAAIPIFVAGAVHSLAAPHCEPRQERGRLHRSRAADQEPGDDGRPDRTVQPPGHSRVAAACDLPRRARQDEDRIADDRPRPLQTHQRPLRASDRRPGSQGSGRAHGEGRAQQRAARALRRRRVRRLRRIRRRRRGAAAGRQAPCRRLVGAHDVRWPHARHRGECRLCRLSVRRHGRRAAHAQGRHGALCRQGGRPRQRARLQLRHGSHGRSTRRARAGPASGNSFRLDRSLLSAARGASDRGHLRTGSAEPMAPPGPRESSCPWTSSSWRSRRA